MEEIDLSDIELITFQENNREFRFAEPYKFTVSLDESETIYIIDDKKSGILIHGETRSELEEILKETIDVYWEEYVLFDKENLLSSDVCKIKKWFLENIKVIEKK